MFRRHQHIEMQTGVSRRLFLAFVAVSIAALAYLNAITSGELGLVAEQFPEWSESFRHTVLHGYKFGVSMLLFFVDIILVGPFAYLSYFGQHIKPRQGLTINKLSFFDLGLILALWFTLSLGVVHYIILDLVSENPRRIAEPETFIAIVGAMLLLWFVLLTLKVKSYTPAQRKELKKYLIRF